MRIHLLKTIIPIFFLSIAPFEAARGAIMSGEERAKQLEAVGLVLRGNVQPIEVELLEKAPSPFTPNLGLAAAKQAAETEVPLSDEELMAALSQYINPTGIFLFGGEFYLVFKEDKKKVGSNVEIMYNGTKYEIIISEITGSTYTVKRGSSELQLKLK